jgi:hypothetical protein
MVLLCSPALGVTLAVGREVVCTGYECKHACFLLHTLTICTVPCKFLCACGLTGQQCLRWHASRGHGRRLRHEPLPVHGTTVLTGLGSHSLQSVEGLLSVTQVACSRSKLKHACLSKHHTLVGSSAVQPNHHTLWSCSPWCTPGNGAAIHIAHTCLSQLLLLYTSS